jgi:hypothetical protein
MTTEEATKSLRESLRGNTNIIGVVPHGKDGLRVITRTHDATLPASHEGYLVIQSKVSLP